MTRLRIVVLATFVVLFGPSSSARADTPGTQQERTGEETYRAACVACHGSDGKGQPKSVLGFDPPSSFPDFSDCAVSSPEPNLMWLAIVHLGGRARGESHIMPAFGDALSDNEIARVVEHLHSFCAEPHWPRGDLNFPRAFFTEKAFPENEVVFTVSATADCPHSVDSRIDYEHRLGRRGQYEIGVPFDLQQGENGQWSRGLGDVNFAYRYTLFDSLPRRSIVAAGGEVTLPTGKETLGLGEGLTIFEGFAMLGQGLPGNGFLQVHTGFERPTDQDRANNSFYWRTVIGKTFAEHRWGRIWSPMVEVLAAKELERGSSAEWDVLPQMQVSLSVFQHVRLDVGVRIPVTQRETRGSAVLAYLLWDWFDAGFFDFWRVH